MSEAKDLFYGDGDVPGDISHTSLETVIDSYIRYYASGSTHTSRAKRLDLNHFIDFLTKHCGYSKPSKLKVLDWDYTSVQRFVDSRLEKGESPATVARRLATLKHMGRTLSERIAGFTNPAKDIKSPKVQKARPKAVEKQEIEKIREKARSRSNNKQSFQRYRNETLFALLLDTGLRADEIRLLRRHQLDDTFEWLHNVRTKGRRYRNVYISEQMREPLMEYLEARSTELSRYFAKLTVAQDKKLPLFISGYGANAKDPDSFLMGAKSIWRAINELSTETKLHPHLLRHSFAIDLLDNSRDIRLVAQALGHSDVRVTMRYTERGDEEVAKAIETARKGDT